MGSKSKKIIILSIYFLSPIITSIVYWFQEPVSLLLGSNDFLTQLIHRGGSILGIFSYIWMCFNIILITKIRFIETTFRLKDIMRFHKTMSLIVVMLGAGHMRPSVHRPYVLMQIITGVITAVIIIMLGVFALIYMTNWFIHSKKIIEWRISAFKKDFKYHVHKIVHNLNMLAIIMLFIHVWISDTSKLSPLLFSVYLFFFIITIVSWVYHKLLKRPRLESDPFVILKSFWRTRISEIAIEANNEWALKMIEENPSLYPCRQCGLCTFECPISKITQGEYSPRKIIEYSLFGLKERLFVDKNPNIWDCTFCLSCLEICPQGVRLTDIFTLLKNEVAMQNQAPSAYIQEAKLVFKTGSAIPLHPVIIKRREKLNLPPIKKYDVKEIQDLMSLMGINEILGNSKTDNFKEGI